MLILKQECVSLKKTNAGVNANIVIVIAIVIALGVNGTLELLSVVD